MFSSPIDSPSHYYEKHRVEVTAFRSCCLNLQGYLKSQTLQPMDQVSSEVMLVEFVQVSVAEIVIRDMRGKHMVDGH